MVCIDSQKKIFLLSGIKIKSEQEVLVILKNNIRNGKKNWSTKLSKYVKVTVHCLLFAHFIFGSFSGLPTMSMRGPVSAKQYV